MSTEPIRTKIDEIDTALLALLALRREQSKKMKAVKKASGASITDPQREETLKRKWQTQALALGLNDAFALAILDRILIESKRIQED